MLMGKRRGTWSFVQNLLMALLSVTLLFIIAYAFLSVFIPQEIDPYERMGNIERLLTKEFEPGDIEYAFFSVGKDEYMVIYTQDYAKCESDEWPEVGPEQIGICTGPRDASPRMQDAICKQFDIKPILGEGELFSFRLGPFARDVKHSSDALGVKEGLCIQPNGGNRNYRMELWIAEGTWTGKRIIRLDIYNG
jgi:hypothetical protein